MKILIFVLVLTFLPFLTLAEEKPWISLYNSRDLSGWQTTGNWIPQKDGSLLIKPRKGEKG